MKNIVIILFLGIGFTTQTQTIDYNIKKKFAASGYDVVAYFNNQALEGNTNYIATYDSVNYTFSSQNNLETFNKTPQKYVPQYGGYCAYAVAVKGKKAAINPETFEIRNGKLYLFYNAWGTNTLESWLNETPLDLIKTADKEWETIKFKS